MKMKVILVNFQNEYLSKKGKWYRKSKMPKFITTRFIPFCERHKLPVYEIKSDFGSPNLTKNIGCAPGTYGFKTLIPDSKFAAKPFIKSDNSPNFVRENNGEMPVEKPLEFKHWLDVNIGDPSQIGYVLVLGMGLESSIALIGNEMAKYGYKIRILKEGTESTNKNKKYTDFMLDKFPLVSWGKIINFVTFVKDMNKYAKIVPVESNWRPSLYLPLGDDYSVIETDTSLVAEKKETLKESEKRPINLMTTDENETLSKAETIAMMKNQMKNQYKNSETIETDNSEENLEEEIEETVKPITRNEQKLSQADAARKRVEDYYRKMNGGEVETTKEVEPITPQVTEPVRVEPVRVQPVEPPVVTKVEPIITQPVVQQIHIKSAKPAPSKEKYAYIFDSMIYIENQLYKNRPKEVTPANFVKSNIINGNVGTRKNIKPKTTNINKISVHERYMLQAQKQKRDNAINGVKTKLSSGKKGEE